MATPVRKSPVKIVAATVVILATVAYLAITGVRDNKSYYVTISELQGMGDKAYPFVEMHCEQARALAAWALGVSEREIDAMISRGTTYSVPLPEVIPVSLAYYTQFPDEAGQVVSYPDIYGSRQAKERITPESARLAQLSVPSTEPAKPQP